MIGKGIRKVAGKRQKGMLMVEMSIALVIAALAAVGTLREQVRADTLAAADVEADKFLDMRKALQDYTDDFYTELQFGLPITRNGVTLAVGTGVGETYNPNSTKLKQMGYLNAGYVDDSMFQSGQLKQLISLLPTGCVTVGCTVEGMMWTSKPYLVRGTTDIDGVVLGEILTKFGGMGGYSVLGSEANIVGNGNGWAYPNPVAGQPAGIFGARFGASTSLVLNFVRINDVRDPNLQGNFTLAGNGSIGGTFAVTGDTSLAGALNVTGNTALGAGLTVAGPSTLSDTTVNGTLGVTGAITGGSSLTARSLSAVDGGGVVRAGMDSATGVLSVNNAGGSGTVLLDGASGGITANTARLLASAAAGGACANAGEIAQDGSATGSLLVCKAGAYRRMAMGLGEVALGGPCATVGSVGQSTAGEGLICRGGSWRSMNDRMASTIAMGLYSANGAAIVPSPACGVGGTPDIIVTPLHTGADYGGAPPRNRFESQVSGSGPWTVNPVLVDTSGVSSSTSFGGAAYNFGWSATTYCVYPS